MVVSYFVYYLVVVWLSVQVQLPGKTRFCVEWDVKLYSLTRSFINLLFLVRYWNLTVTKHTLFVSCKRLLHISEFLRCTTAVFSKDGK